MKRTFNSIKVRLKPNYINNPDTLFSTFNSIKVRLKRNEERFSLKPRALSIP